MLIFRIKLDSDKFFNTMKSDSLLFKRAEKASIVPL